MSGIARGALRAYRRSVSDTLATGQATEHSYRPALQALVEELGGDDVRAVNEPSQIACGAPDFVVVRGGVPMGHIECKDVGAHLDRTEAGEQLARYRAGLPNLILTDYLEFRRYVDGEWRATARLGRIDGRGGIVVDRDSTQSVGALFDTFLAVEPPTVADPRELAERMASKARLLRDSIKRILREEGRSGPLREMLTAYRNILIAGLSDDEFADLQAQTAAYGLFAGALPGRYGGPAVHSPVRRFFGHDTVSARRVRPHRRSRHRPAHRLDRGRSRIAAGPCQYAIGPS